MALDLGPLYADFSKQRITGETLRLLTDLAEEAGVPVWRDKLFGGAPINETEGRAVLHTALRQQADDPLEPGGEDIIPDIRRVQARLADFVEAVRSGVVTGVHGGRFTDIVNIGIGGSDLGPRMAAEALTPFRRRDLKVHFVSNVDGTAIAEVLRQVQPETTLFIVASKSFTTQETLANARTARQWFLDQGLRESAVAEHFVALSTNLDAVKAFGIRSDRVFGFWDWVGGRYSLWSSIGLSLALGIGWDNFRRLLSGAARMDAHFINAPLDRNIPVLMALIGIWNRNFLNCPALAVLPYDEYLRYFPAYLQQLEMESNGKRVTRDGAPVDYATAPVLFGVPGTDGQHAFYQQLHQGPDVIPADFIGFAHSHNDIGDHHRLLLANLIAQSQALAFGRDEDAARLLLDEHGLSDSEVERLAPHTTFPGNRPSTTLLFRRLDPETLGMLIALYEHKVFTQGVIWQINSFDQFGVELGKTLAKGVLKDLQAGSANPDQDASTAALIRRVMP